MGLGNSVDGLVVDVLVGRRAPRRVGVSFGLPDVPDDKNGDRDGGREEDPSDDGEEAAIANGPKANDGELGDDGGNREHHAKNEAGGRAGEIPALKQLELFNHVGVDSGPGQDEGKAEEEGHNQHDGEVDRVGVVKNPPLANNEAGVQGEEEQRGK